MEMWTCFDGEKIHSLLENAKFEAHQVTLWQPNAREEKVYGKIVEFNEKQTTIELEPFKKKTPFSATDPLFVHCELDDIIFKKDKYNREGLIISFDNPEEIKIRDKRKVGRFPYRYQDFKAISLEYDCTSTPEKTRKKLGGILVDVSTEGASFVIPQEEADDLYPKQEVFTTRLTDQNLPKEHKGEIIYVVPFKIVKGGIEKTSLLQVGINFTEPLESVSYKSIQNIVAKKQKRVRGLDVNSFNGLDPEDQERILKKITRENMVLGNQLRDHVDDLDRLRYMTTDMKKIFLMEVNQNLLAAALRLSSKELIFELLSELTENMRDEFLEKLDVPKPPSAINKAQDEICKFISDMEKKGDLVLDPTAFETFV